MSYLEMPKLEGGGLQRPRAGSCKQLPSGSLEISSHELEL
jgi:hypothetical protein